MQFRGLPGIKDKVRDIPFHSQNIADVFHSLKTPSQVAAMAGDNGSISVHIDDDGKYRCCFCRRMCELDNQIYDTQKEVRAWLKKWIPQMDYSRPSSTKITRFELKHTGKNPKGYSAEAETSGDPGLYDELRVGIFNRKGKCVADVLVGLDALKREPRLLITTDGEGDGDHTFAVFPMRSPHEAITKLDS